MSTPSKLLSENIAQLSLLIKPLNAIDTPVLDLACGMGRNGQYMLSQGFACQFADRNNDAIQAIKASLTPAEQLNASFWLVDFEQADFTELAQQRYSAIIVFRYLHRALFQQIKQAIIPGGTLVYETFTEQHPQYGRPTNPHFLLKKDELRQLFADWQIQHYFEGTTISETGGNSQAIAQIIAVKPIQ
ncbi:methyltransferase domain-containing protein [Thalassotalea sp. PLHSN55]|uniref:methyltransferase domain-containing protein n=1 Tax=Thalassotalea sp. PLHSN55 TaxID=3435888 RepID=UPI003F83ED5A